ncbi:hypothetical protein ZWY2020_026472 [Hordeum vulgare]|nr:hypothetical protein ZWY2020_026472 [Hordeum vulgare]
MFATSPERHQTSFARHRGSASVRRHYVLSPPPPDSASGAASFYHRGGRGITGLSGHLAGSLVPGARETGN